MQCGERRTPFSKKGKGSICLSKFVLGPAGDRWRWKIWWCFPEKVMILLPLTLVLIGPGPKSVVKKIQNNLWILLLLPATFCGNYSFAILILCLKAKQDHDLQRAESRKAQSSVAAKKIWNSFDSFYAVKLSDFPDSCKANVRCWLLQGHSILCYIPQCCKQNCIIELISAQDVSSHERKHLRTSCSKYAASCIFL